MSFSRAAGVKRTLRKKWIFFRFTEKILQYSLKFLWKKPWITLSLWSQIINRKKNRLFKWRQKVSLLLLQAIMKWKMKNWGRYQVDSCSMLKKDEILLPAVSCRGRHYVPLPSVLFCHSKPLHVLRSASMNHLCGFPVFLLTGSSIFSILPSACALSLLCTF